eukprot:TRINITY_DN1659_c0_g1_i16.p1 TRINITY_DN1659_c0_g1~~TRINITY_DN1659_c0_g1_i16.p1  ORF type:complete len:121 (+),score=13.88 TRINITY_DN1659_c0_g1_i16:148-510(+)
MRMRDAHNIARSLKVTETLTIINLANNAIDDERFRIICTGLLMNQTLTDLDFSHNKIGDSGARAIAKVLVTPNCIVRKRLREENRYGWDEKRDLHCDDCRKCSMPRWMREIDREREKWKC